jgi:murein DD-endopeptidase MepM/ murein hydrolase activator NlpD
MVASGAYSPSFGRPLYYGGQVPGRRLTPPPTPQAYEGVLLSRGFAYAMAAFMTLLALWTAGTLWYFLNKDDLAAHLLAQQSRMQYAYEGKIGELRGRIDRVMSQKLMEQNGVEGRVAQLVGRQMQIENRQSVLASLVEHTSATGSIAPAKAAPKTDGLNFNLFAPIPKPSPETDQPELRMKAPARDSRASSSSRPDEHLNQVESSLSHAEVMQIRTLDALVQNTHSETRTLRSAIADIGFDPEQMDIPTAKGTGGPFVPVKLDKQSGAFETLASQLQNNILILDRLRRTTMALPFRRPMPADTDMSSNFGPRVDPFTKGMAMHTGIDFRAEYGAPVKATGAGKVISADHHGGYGNMVEVDHGNGVTTRYAHLSSISVSLGQNIGIGTIVGRIGSTGRSTGPHLHYETRIDGDAVDPMKFLRAGHKITKSAL